MPFRPRRLTEKLKALTRMGHWSRSQAEKHRGGENGRCFLLELPTELLLEIISHLEVLPEACLALTCKRLFAISGAMLDSKSLRFNRDFAPLFHHYKNTHNFNTTRWKFLKVLEDSKWRACSNCLKLHPKAAFSSRELRRKSETRMCNLGELAGIVDLCPCKKLTFRDKVDLIDHLQIRQKTVAALAAQFGNETRERYCWHTCTEKYESTELTTEIFPELDENNQLIMRTEYQLTTAPGQLGKEEHMTPRLGCAHRSMDLWLSSICHSTVCQIHDSVCTSCKRISICSCCNTVLKCPQRRPSGLEGADKATYSFWTERCLGGASSAPDKDWAAQRIHPAEPSVSLDNCSELCPWTVREHPPLTWPPSLDMHILDPAINDQSMSQLYSSIRMI